MAMWSLQYCLPQTMKAAYDVLSVENEASSVASAMLLQNSNISANFQSQRNELISKNSNAVISTCVKQQFSKTKLCPFHCKGKCHNGFACTFAHSEDELRPLPDLKNTKLCEYSKKGQVCPLKNCAYAHSVDALRPSKDLHTFKTSMCFFWKKGTCFNGDKCRFAHGSREIREKTAESEEIRSFETGIEKSDDDLMSSTSQSTTNAGSVSISKDVGFHSHLLAATELGLREAVTRKMLLDSKPFTEGGKKINASTAGLDRSYACSPNAYQPAGKQYRVSSREQNFLHKEHYDFGGKISNEQEGDCFANREMEVLYQQIMQLVRASDLKEKLSSSNNDFSTVTRHHDNPQDRLSYQSVSLHDRAELSTHTPMPDGVDYSQLLNAPRNAKEPVKKDSFEHACSHGFIPPLLPKILNENNIINTEELDRCATVESINEPCIYQRVYGKGSNSSNFKLAQQKCGFGSGLAWNNQDYIGFPGFGYGEVAKTQNSAVNSIINGCLGNIPGFPKENTYTLNGGQERIECQKGRPDERNNLVAEDEPWMSGGLDPLGIIPLSYETSKPFPCLLTSYSSHENADFNKASLAGVKKEVAQYDCIAELVNKLPPPVSYGKCTEVADGNNLTIKKNTKIEINSNNEDYNSSLFGSLIFGKTPSFDDIEMFIKDRNMCRDLGTNESWPATECNTIEATPIYSAGKYFSSDVYNANESIALSTDNSDCSTNHLKEFSLPNSRLQSSEDFARIVATPRSDFDGRLSLEEYIENVNAEFSVRESKVAIHTDRSEPWDSKDLAHDIAQVPITSEVAYPLSAALDEMKNKSSNTGTVASLAAKLYNYTGDMEELSLASQKLTSNELEAILEGKAWLPSSFTENKYPILTQQDSFQFKGCSDVYNYPQFYNGISAKPNNYFSDNNLRIGGATGHSVMPIMPETMELCIDHKTIEATDLIDGWAHTTKHDRLDSFDKGGNQWNQVFHPDISAIKNVWNCNGERLT